MTHKSARRSVKMLRNWGYLCAVCGHPFANLACVTVEHLVPRSMTNEVETIQKPRKSDNLAPSHFRCNMLRRVSSIIAAANKINQIERQRNNRESFLSWLNRPVPRKGISPWYCYVPIVDAEWFFL